ncbi:hypothetical protein B188_01430 [Candidatus Brocadiaceae bacterium B188]|nr:hypothetical protein [Candidatus Brocadia sapporoensis]QQR67397.1 MAG: hypothetical protein IPI25_04030 [Candidatus Brocadia sp.]RZV57182.1 MAG: hypothetical protein EX330_10945 [Candidatus Brocadia sp. BROELEC01]TWU52196.1 hypothetical protein B188_01430 [Candidatus Brocadiaceae bacterium B188]
MIVNIYTLIMLFVAFLSLFLGIFLFYATIKMLLGFKSVVPLETKNTYEQAGYLVFLTACVILSVRMLAWPWFYFMLQSFVPEVPGAMCMFGVTQILPFTVTFLQIIKPISFFIMGGWLLCYYVDKAVPTSPLLRRNLYFLLVACVILLIDSITDISYVLRMKPLMSVSCCATFFDVPLRPSAMIPLAIFGKHFQEILFVLYYLINIFLIVLLFVILSRKWLFFTAFTRKIILSGLTVAGVFNVPVVIYAFIENIVPRLMQLPYHHCIYCFMGKGVVPDAPIILGLFVIGTFAIGWAGILRMLCIQAETQSITEHLIKKINGLSIFCLLASLVMVTIHLLFT